MKFAADIITEDSEGQQYAQQLYMRTMSALSKQVKTEISKLENKLIRVDFFKVGAGGVLLKTGSKSASQLLQAV